MVLQAPVLSSADVAQKILQYLSSHSTSLTYLFKNLWFETNSSWEKVFHIKWWETTAFGVVMEKTPNLRIPSDILSRDNLGKDISDESARELIGLFLDFLNSSREYLVPDDIHSQSAWRDAFVLMLSWDWSDGPSVQVFQAIQNYRAAAHRAIFEKKGTTQTSGEPVSSEQAKQCYDNLTRVRIEASRESVAVIQELFEGIDDTQKLEMLLTAFVKNENTFFEMFQENSPIFLWVACIVSLLNALTQQELHIFLELVFKATNNHFPRNHLVKVAFFFREIPKTERHEWFQEKRIVVIKQILWMKNVEDIEVAVEVASGETREREWNDDASAGKEQTIETEGGWKWEWVATVKKEEEKDFVWRNRAFILQQLLFNQKAGEREPSKENNALLWRISEDTTYTVAWWHVINEIPEDRFVSFFEKLMLMKDRSNVQYAWSKIGYIFEDSNRRVLISLLSWEERGGKCSLADYHDCLLAVLCHPQTPIVEQLKDTQDDAQRRDIILQISQKKYASKYITYPGDTERTVNTKSDGSWGFALGEVLSWMNVFNGKGIRAIRDMCFEFYRKFKR